ncbi:MAG: ATP-binding protein [Desulfovibrionaceae bacterium]|nr:ATP-binding protein [Desulfovibrionaceae bacterium]
MEHMPVSSGKLPTRNVTLLMELVSRIRNRPDSNLPGMGTFYGPTGYGKSMAVCACAIPHQAYYVQMRSVWTRKYLLEMIMSQMNIASARMTMPQMLTQVGKQLSLSGRPLIIDEADLLVGKGMIEIVRDIYESSQGTVILVGEENLPGHLEVVERVHGRMLDWVAAQPADIADARLFAGKHCAGLSIADDLLERILEASHGSARYVCTNLVRVAEFARMKNLEDLDAALYTGALFTGKAPARRRA